MKLTFLAAAVAATLLAAPAFAQTDMKCADYIKADDQMKAAMSPADRATLTADPTAAAMDRKMRDYCVANPTALVSQAMNKAMGL